MTLTPLPPPALHGAEEPWPVVHPAAYHGLAGDVVAALVPHTEADPAGLLMTFLVFFGNALGPGPYAEADGSKHRARLNVLLVGDTSRGRKGTTAARMKSIFEYAAPDWLSERFLSGLGSGEALVECAGDERDRRLLVYEEEFVRILAVAGRDGSTLSAIIRQAWDTGDLAVITRKNPVKARGAHISVVSHITVEELRRRLLETEAVNGFANRFLFVVVRRDQLLPEGGAADPRLIPELGYRVRSALESARRVEQLRRTDVAKKRWADLYYRLAQAPAGGLFGAATARAEAQALRLSILYALLDGAREIDEVHVEAAAAAWDYCERSAALVFGDSTGDQVADVILRALREVAPEGLDGRAISGLFERNVSGSRLAQARRLLESRGLIVTETIPGDRGRPRTVSKAVPPRGSAVTNKVLKRINTSDQQIRETRVCHKVAADDAAGISSLDALRGAPTPTSTNGLNSFRDLVRTDATENEPW